MRALLVDADDHAAAAELLGDPSWNLVSSQLLRLEARRISVRLMSLSPLPGSGSLMEEADRNLDGFYFVAITPRVLRGAHNITQVIKTLDAIHVATALILSDAIECVVTYDKAMTRVLGDQGIRAATAAEALSGDGGA